MSNTKFNNSYEEELFHKFCLFMSEQNRINESTVVQNTFNEEQLVEDMGTNDMDTNDMGTNDIGTDNTLDNNDTYDDYEIKEIVRHRKIGNNIEYEVVYVEYGTKEWILEEYVSETALDEYNRRVCIKTGKTKQDNRIIYGLCRVSTEAQAGEDHMSLEGQESLLTAVANKEEYSGAYLKIIKVTNSAYKRVAKEIKEIVEDSLSGDIILVSRVDRFTRNSDLISPYLCELIRKNVNVISVTEGVNLLNDKINFKRFILDGENESDNISKRVKASIEYRKSNGLYKRVSPVGYGKKKVNTKLGNKIIIDKQASAIIKRVVKEFSKCINNKEQNRVSKELADEFNVYGITKNGKSWSPLMIKNLYNKHK